jgi:C4-dicarboxylate transporter DctM subunit
MTWTLFGAFFVLVMLGVPITFSLGLASLTAIAASGLSLMVLPQRILPAVVDASVLVCIPMFILAGNILSYGGIGERLVKLANMLVGRRRGGLGSANVLASMFFGGISGSAAADTAAVGSVMIPAMEKLGYDKAFATAITVISSPLGAIIPPSIIMIVYCWVTETSIASIFAAGYLPGLLIGVMLMTTGWVISVRKGYPTSDGCTRRELWTAIVQNLPALFMPVLIIGGIVGGVATATETAALAVIYGFLVARFYYGELAWSSMPAVFLDTVKLTGMVMLLIAMAAVYGWLLAFDRVPYQVAALLGQHALTPGFFLALYMLLMVFLGCFLAPTEALIIAVPILYPVANLLGIDPLHFGIVSVTSLAFGHVTPPVGVCLFIGQSISGLPMGRLIRALLPFYLAALAALLLIAFFPAISTALPTALGLGQ